MNRDRIFISYSHKDVKWLREVRRHLGILEHKYEFIIWDDTQIRAGSDWKKEIRESIEKCKAAIFLVSNNFLASEFIIKNELPIILKAAAADEVTIFNVIIERCAYQLTELKTLQRFNAHPLDELKPSERREVLVRLTEELLSVIEESRRKNCEDVHLTSDEENIHFCMILILSYLIKKGGKTITDIEVATSIQRKIIVAALDQLQKQGYIEKFQGVNHNKPSTIWKSSLCGQNVFSQFEEEYNSIVKSSR